LYVEFGADPEAVDKVAEQLGRSRKSVQGKLSYMDVYVVPEKPKAAKKDEGPTKGEILTAISKFMDPDGLDSATKPALKRVLTLAEKIQTTD
jgi:hypothetical protein